MARILGALLFWAVVLLTSCKAPPGEPQAPGGAISCAAEAVKRNWPSAYPHVMTCLTEIMDSPMSCLDSVPSVAAVSMDTVACIVRGAGREAAMQAEQNPDDVVTMRKAERARVWLESRGFVFQ